MHDGPVFCFAYIGIHPLSALHFHLCNPPLYLQRCFEPRLSAMYSPVPTSERTLYPPTFREEGSGPPYPLRRNKQDRRWLVVKLVTGSFVAIFIFHYFILGAFPTSAYTQHFRPVLETLDDAAYSAAAAAASHEILEHLDPAAGQPGTFFRDTRPIRSMLAFFELAEKEVKTRGLDTCDGQLGKELIDAYHRSHMAYCLPQGEHSLVPNTSLTAFDTPSRIWCAPVHRDSFSKWWPYPAAPCLSTNIRAVADNDRQFRADGCTLTEDGEKLKDEMDKERFLGSDLQKIEADVSQCKEILDRTLIVIGRQDQWNP